LKLTILVPLFRSWFLLVWLEAKYILKLNMSSILYILVISRPSGVSYQRSFSL